MTQIVTIISFLYHRNSIIAPFLSIYKEFRKKSKKSLQNDFSFKDKIKKLFPTFEKSETAFSVAAENKNRRGCIIS